MSTVLTTVPRIDANKFWNDYLELDGMKVSEMDIYQKRLTDFFTRRDYKDGHYIRVLSQYPVALLSYLGLLPEGTNRTTHVENRPTIIEDVELNLPLHLITSRRAMDESMKSITEQAYKPLRFFKGTKQTFDRVNYSAAKGYYLAPVKDYDSKGIPWGESAPELDFEVGDRKFNDLTLGDINSAIQSGATADGTSVTIGDNKVEIGCMIPAATMSSSLYLTKMYMVSILAMWSNTPLEAPSWVKEALAHVPENLEDDPELLKELQFRNLTLGEYNIGTIGRVRHSGNSTSAVISVAINGYQDAYNIKPVSRAPKKVSRKANSTREGRYTNVGDLPSGSPDL